MGWNVSNILVNEAIANKKVGGGGSLSDLSDIAITTPNTGQVLKYNSTNEKWENSDIGIQGYIRDLLFENDPLPSPTAGTSSVSRTYTLSSSIDGYDAVLLVFYGYYSSSGASHVITNLILKPDFQVQSTEGFLANASNPTALRYLEYKFTNSTTLSTVANRNDSGVEPILLRIYGLKFAKVGTTEAQRTRKRGK